MWLTTWPTACVQLMLSSKHIITIITQHRGHLPEMIQNQTREQRPKLKLDKVHYPCQDIWPLQVDEVCVRVFVCVFPPLHNHPLSLRALRRTETRLRRAAAPRPCFLSPPLLASRDQTALCLFVAGLLVHPSSHPLHPPPLSVPLMPPLRRWIRGDLWSTKEAARWIWRVLGTQTLSPLRYLPPKLNSRFLAGEYRLPNCVLHLEAPQMCPRVK